MTVAGLEWGSACRGLVGERSGVGGCDAPGAIGDGHRPPLQL